MVVFLRKTTMSPAAHGPVYKVEDTVLYLGTEQGSYVRVNFPTTEAVNGLWEVQEVDLVGTLAFRWDHLLLQDARFKR
jgi:hypothetical protein